MTFQKQSTSYAELREKNRQFLWNPFTQMKDYLAGEPVIVSSARGLKLIDVDGKEYYDGNSSLWLNVHGHAHDELNAAIVDQLGRVAHSTLLGMASVPAIELAERLVTLAPDRLAKVFYSDSGATAVEVGLKMAFAYWRRIGRPEKRRFVAFENGYHGDTVATMSVGGIGLYQAEFGPLLFDCERIPFPYSYRFPGSEAECSAACLGALESLLVEKADEIACLVVEPMIQGAGGMITMPLGFLSAIEQLVRSYDVLLFADEVATGFGRTGAMFACGHERVEPDLMALGKGLTAGYLPVAATLTSNAIYDAFYGDYAELRTFFHGHSFTGNQLGCAVALASLELFEHEDVIGHTKRSARHLTTLLKALNSCTHVGEVRQCGLMVGIELVANKDTKQAFDWTARTGDKVCRRARELGMITRPLGDVVVFMPPLASELDDLEEMVAILHRAIEEVTST